MLFNLFGKKPNPLGTEQYEFERVLDGNTYTISVDLSHEETFLEKKTYMNVIVVAFTLLREVGEREKLTDALGDLSKSLGSITKSIFVGTVSDAKLLIGYIVTTNPVEEATVREFLGKHKQEYALTFSADPGWNFITATLFPTSAERQHVNNKGLIALAKIEQGQDATPPNGVFHTMSFKTVDAGNGFCLEVEPLGFRRISMEGNKDRTYSLLFTVSKQCPVTIGELNTQTDLIIPLVEKHEGRYEGWQATGVA